jgi:hypothetical protein
MRLFGIAVIRDEDDVLEAFVRHNLRYLDRLHIVAHCCSDSSEQVLDSLRHKGFAISVVRQQEKALRKAAWLNELAAQSFSEGADAVAPLDADEFIKVEDREGLARRLDSMPKDLHPAWQWQSYVPTVEFLSRPPGTRTNVLREIRHRLKRERWMVPKLILRHGAARVGWRFDEGAHRLVGGRDMCRVGLMTHCWLAHFPIRSLVQFEQKVTRGWHARLIHRPTPSTSCHWQHIYESMVCRRATTPQLVRRIAADYQRWSGEWASLQEWELVVDAMDVSNSGIGSQLVAANAVT